MDLPHVNEFRMEMPLEKRLSNRTERAWYVFTPTGSTQVIAPKPGIGRLACTLSVAPGAFGTA